MEIPLDDTKKETTLEALNGAASFIRGELSKRVEIRHTPELKFIYDESIQNHTALGYDHCWLADNFEDKQLKEIAILSEPTSGRVLTISSTQVGAQVYTGNWLNDSPLGKNGHKYFDYCAVAIECQGLPDAPNKPNFPSQYLKPGETYQQTIEYSFKTTKI